MHAGFIGAIIGCVLGLAGGIIGTYFSIKNTNGPKERAFIVRAAVIGWIAIGIFLALLLILPSPYRWFMWIPYGILLPVGIIFGNKRQAKIRAEESKTAKPAEPTAN
jgi:MFS family permease